MGEMTVRGYSPLRVVAVTLGLSGAGALFGGLAGSVVVSVGLALGGRPPLLDLGFLLVAGVVGGILGAVCAPLTGWMLLRRVPLGRAFGNLTLGTVVGGLVGWFLPHAFDAMVVQTMVAAALGFLVTAIILRLLYSRAA